MLRGEESLSRECREGEWMDDEMVKLTRLRLLSIILGFVK
jgi:hypothetical protein